MPPKTHHVARTRCTRLGPAPAHCRTYLRHICDFAAQPEASLALSQRRARGGGRNTPIPPAGAAHARRVPRGRTAAKTIAYATRMARASEPAPVGSLGGIAGQGAAAQRARPCVA